MSRGGCVASLRYILNLPVHSEVLDQSSIFNTASNGVSVLRTLMHAVFEQKTQAWCVLLPRKLHPQFHWKSQIVTILLLSYPVSRIGFELRKFPLHVVDFLTQFSICQQKLLCMKHARVMIASGLDPYVLNAFTWWIDADSYSWGDAKSEL